MFEPSIGSNPQDMPDGKQLREGKPVGVAPDRGATVVAKVRLRIVRREAAVAEGDRVIPLHGFVERSLPGI